MKWQTVILLCMGMPLVAVEHRIVVVTAAYNNKAYYQRVLDSVFGQKYGNWHLMYTDDCSPDGAGALIEQYIQEKGYQDNCTIMRNETRRGAMANQYHMIQQLNDHDIVIILDGDDWFASPDVLGYINEVYNDPNVWLTYGQYREHPSGAKGFCCSMPKDIVRRNAFRDFAHIPSHLRTFYAGLFKQIKKEDLMHDGEFFVMCADIAAMMPMIEMARDHFKFIPHVLLIYNGESPINDHKVSKKMQRQTDLLIRGRARYEKIETPFLDAVQVSTG